MVKGEGSSKKMVGHAINFLRYIRLIIQHHARDPVTPALPPPPSHQRVLLLVCWPYVWSQNVVPRMTPQTCMHSEGIHSLHCSGYLYNKILWQLLLPTAGHPAHAAGPSSAECPQDSYQATVTSLRLMYLQGCTCFACVVLRCTRGSRAIQPPL